MRPTVEVLAAFGVSEPVVKLPGGRGAAWRAGDLTLKPADVGVQELRWLHEAGLRIATRDTIRISMPLASRSGQLAIDGWTAFPFLAGERIVGRWSDIAAVASEFAACFVNVDRPSFLDERDHAWARSDRFAWEECDEPSVQDAPRVAELMQARRPTTGAPGIIHGDLTGNVLFSPDMSPAVIDPTIYWRPLAYSVAIVAIDAVCFENAPLSLLERISPDPEFPQHAIRALIFRMATDQLNGRLLLSHYAEAIDRVLDMAARPGHPTG